MDLTPRLLEQFTVLAEEKHFGRAASRLMMSQPPLSQAVQRLERIIGTRLLDRSSQGVSLTPAGEAFATDARKILEAQESALARARRIASGKEGEVRVGFVTGLGHWHLPRVLADAAEQLPGLRLHVRQGSSGALTELVRSGTVDLALVRQPELDEDDLTVHRLTEERLVAALPVADPLAKNERLALADLRHHQFAGLGDGPLQQLARRVLQACERAGFVPGLQAYADDLPGLLGYVASGLCVALVPEHTAALSFPGIRFLPLTDEAPELTTTIAALHRPHADPAVRSLLAVAAASLSG
ncbi:LysR family transcriptional regulator [Streptomyces sp. VRA16 Mangrove soil]|uniref:LysR family transcriptional regulator n=1 Tax=Streptomyces sp. VRA16 Mangrove soil TaxID=2817434 RepID=UPI001A9D5FF0|nr:LysR substrate-binding domain-containing protein [Streptomyces sp. VRA16 Mangrove soil]MBO1331408.1 LysR family transcriptional regulator [Streptomyces sp. VRA16 Mangrove soil]